MDEMSSDPGSVMSDDSLEAHRSKKSSQINLSTSSLSNPNEVIVPFCKGDVLIQLVPTVDRKGARISKSVSNNSFENKKCHSARIGNQPRLSRKHILEENSNLVRPRYRSVSYLEQFRGKLYGVNQSTSVISSGRSHPREQRSCKSEDSYVPQDLSVSSEIEYYLNLTQRTESTQLTVNNEAVQLLDPTHTSKQKKNVRQNKVCLVV